MSTPTLLLPPSWQGIVRANVRKFDADDVEVLDTRHGRILVAKARLRTLTEDRLASIVEEGPVAVDTLREGVRPYEVATAYHNLLVNVGITRALNLLAGLGGQAYDSTHSRIGVGDDNTAAANSQTDLQAAAGATHRQFEVQDATFPSLSAQTMTWRSTFTSGEGNFAWQEWCIDDGTAASTAITTPMLNRKVASLGTKVVGTVWQHAASLTLS